jgi:hypothetical protein
LYQIHSICQSFIVVLGAFYHQCQAYLSAAKQHFEQQFKRRLSPRKTQQTNVLNANNAGAKHHQPRHRNEALSDATKKYNQ